MGEYEAEDADAESVVTQGGSDPAVDSGPPDGATAAVGGQTLLPGFIELMERTQREAFDLHEEARHIVAQARDEAAQLRSAAVAEASLIRDRATAETEWLRRDNDRLWATFSRFLAAAAELVSVLGPLMSTRSDQQRDPVSSVIQPPRPGPAAPPASAPPSPAASEADLLAAEERLRGMLDMTRGYFPTS